MKKLNNIMKKQLTPFILVFALFFFAIAFIKAEINPFNWSEETRTILIVLLVIVYYAYWAGKKLTEN